MNNTIVMLPGGKDFKVLSEAESDTEAAMRRVFVQQADLNRQGHLGDIVAHDVDLNAAAEALAQDFPDETKVPPTGRTAYAQK